MEEITLTIDFRERNVYCHMGELSDVKIVYKQLTVGDYLITRGAAILAVIERKTLSDAVSSFCDGRWENREKLFALRDAAACSVIFLIEKSQGNDPAYKAIESSLFHMMIRDNVKVLWTTDSADTAATLKRFCKSMETLDMAKKSNNFIIVGSSATTSVSAANDAVIDDAPRATAVDYISMATSKIVKSPRKIITDIWCQFKGVSISTAACLAAKVSFRELLTEPHESLSKKLLMPNGRKINKNVVALLLDKTAATEVFIRGVPKIGKKTADAIIESKVDISAATNKAHLCAIKISGRALASDIIDNILYYLDYKTDRDELVKDRECRDVPNSAAEGNNEPESSS